MNGVAVGYVQLREVASCSTQTTGNESGLGTVCVCERDHPDRVGAGCDRR